MKRGLAFRPILGHGSGLGRIRDCNEGVGRLAILGNEVSEHDFQAIAMLLLCEFVRCGYGIVQPTEYCLTAFSKKCSGNLRPYRPTPHVGDICKSLTCRRLGQNTPQVGKGRKRPK
jgi:hypothetical protein